MPRPNTQFAFGGFSPQASLRRSAAAFVLQTVTSERRNKSAKMPRYRIAVIAVAGTETVKSICTSPPTMLTSTSSNSFPSAMPSASPTTMATSAIMTDSHASTLARFPLPMPRML